MNLKLGCLKIVKIESPEKPEFQTRLPKQEANEGEI